MASRAQQAVSARDDAAACAVTLRVVLANYDLLIRAISHANLWHELAWDGEQAAREARRDVAQGQAALTALAERGAE